ncbi:MAG: hypothetical protein HY854_22980 [Burkholderiales bacterium]|nr:hypothetical protein [Burkholderiales bacterium]
MAYFRIAALCGAIALAYPAAHAQNPIAALAARVSALEATVAAQQASIATLAAQVATLQGTSASQQSALTTLGAKVTAVETSNVMGLNNHVTVTTAAGKTRVRFNAVNLQVVNGLGATDTTNGVGNVIIGYDEASPTSEKTASHSLVLGRENSYSGYGGIVTGFKNRIRSAYSSILSGASNVAGPAELPGAPFLQGGGTILGGVGNYAMGIASVVVGGEQNMATGRAVSVLGGQQNTASGDVAAVVGGALNTAGGARSSILGGQSRSTSTEFQTVP